MTGQQESIDEFVATVERLIADQLAEIARIALRIEEHGEQARDQDAG